MINTIKYIVCLLSLFLTTTAFSQNNIDNVLQQVAENNKSIIANKQYFEARKLMYKTDIAPNNPSIEYENLTGSPSGAGNQIDFFVLQSFDFPTVYIKKKQVANEQVTQDEFMQIAERQTVLLEAKKYCLELTYLNKQQHILSDRLGKIQKLYVQFEEKLKNGALTSMELNKAKFEVLNIENALRENQSEIKLLNHKLTEFNGGNKVEFLDTVYMLTPVVSDFETLESNIEANDPVIKAIQQQKNVDQKKLELSKAELLPTLEGGYHTQAILGQRYQGVHIGMTIPLWHGKNTVKHQKAHLLYNELLLDEHKIEHQSEIKQLFERYENQKIMFQEYEKLLSTMNNQELLDKALSLGEISSTQYFLETSYYYRFYDNYLKLERDYNLTIAEMFKYQL